MRRMRGEKKGREERGGRNVCSGESACEKDDGGGEERKDKYSRCKEYVQDGCEKKGKERTNACVHARRIWRELTS